VDESLSRETDCNAAQLFNVIWETMVDVLGTVVTATLMRRSAKRAAVRRRDLEQLTVDRRGFEYTCQIPSSWTVPSAESVAAIRELARELSPLLSELTGPVLIRRLSAIPSLQRCEILFQEHVS
jgi:hypothetical protein